MTSTTASCKDETQGARDTDARLTAAVKSYALLELNADLVGVADIGRFQHAPLRMSPQGIFPGARSVVVMAVHHPDACIEMGGRAHPQEIGPYRVQYTMNSRLDEMSFRLGVHLERLGYRTVPIASSNIWRYKGYKDLTEQFAPDVSHMHAAVAAGLAEFGYNGLAITPEFGARQRYVTVITDAPLAATPLLEPGSVCDHCMLCAKHCRSGALTKELDGDCVVRIEDKEYRYAKKNLWRCAWGEHFDLDLDLEIPETVTEAIIIEQVRKHGLRSGEMGSCLRYCLPRARRTFDKSYTDAPRRKRDVQPLDGNERRLMQLAEAIAAKWGIDFVLSPDAETLARRGIALTDHLPDARSALVLGLAGRHASHAEALSAPHRDLHGRDSQEGNMLRQAAYDMARMLERHGHSAVVETDLPEAALAGEIETGTDGVAWATQTLITSAALPATPMRAPSLRHPTPLPGPALRRELERTVLETLEADRFGVAPASRLDDLCGQLDVFDGEEVLDVRDSAERFMACEPSAQRVRRRVLRPADYLPGARSVVVIGLRLPSESVACTARPPAEAVGPYAFAQYAAAWQLARMAHQTCAGLERSGHRAVWTFDLAGTGSFVANPRGEQPDAFCNRFAALAAGLARLGKGGFPIDADLGANVRYVAIVTDADLPADQVIRDDGVRAACGDCDACRTACHSAAHGESVRVSVDGATDTFYRIHRSRCDWAKRYSLTGEEGTDYLGWEMKRTETPETITEEALEAALRETPPIPKYRPCNFESCLLACPYGRVS